MPGDGHLRSGHPVDLGTTAMPRVDNAPQRLRRLALRLEHGIDLVEEQRGLSLVDESKQGRDRRVDDVVSVASEQLKDLEEKRLAGTLRGGRNREVPGGLRGILPRARCSGYEACVALISEGTDIDYDGASGLLEFTEPGTSRRPNSAFTSVDLLAPFGKPKVRGSNPGPLWDPSRGSRLPLRGSLIHLQTPRWLPQFCPRRSTDTVVAPSSSYHGIPVENPCSS